VGGNLGGAWPTATLTDNLTGKSFSADQSGFIGGTQIGYNHQIDNLVLGIEWDFDWSNIRATRDGFVGSGIGTIRSSADTPWITTLAGRVGLTLDRTLVYFKIGGGWVRNNAALTNLTSGATVSASNTNGGWLIGAGAEYAFPFLPHWSAKLEYEFLGLADQTGLALIKSGTFDFNRDVQLLKFAISYKFN
jgi:outer membrane immunogenic protein